MTRLIGTDDEQLLDELQTALNDIEAIKLRQRIGGRSLVTYANEITPGSTWDYSGIVSGAISVAKWRVRFTPDHVIDPYTQLVFSYAVAAPSGFETFYAYPDASDIAGDATVNFIIEYRNPNLSDKLVTVKAICKAADTGAVTITRLV